MVREVIVSHADQNKYESERNNGIKEIDLVDQNDEQGCVQKTQLNIVLILVYALKFLLHCYLPLLLNLRACNIDLNHFSNKIKLVLLFCIFLKKPLNLIIN
jgi:hypothetical protein